MEINIVIVVLYPFTYFLSISGLLEQGQPEHFADGYVRSWIRVERNKNS